MIVGDCQFWDNFILGAGRSNGQLRHDMRFDDCGGLDDIAAAAAAGMMVDDVCRGHVRGGG